MATGEALPIAEQWGPWYEPQIPPGEIDSSVEFIEGLGSRANHQARYVVAKTLGLMGMISEQQMTLWYGPKTIPPCIAPHDALDATLNFLAPAVQHSGLGKMMELEAPPGPHGYTAFDAFAAAGEMPTPARMLLPPAMDSFRNRTEIEQYRQSLGLVLMRIDATQHVPGLQVGFGDPYTGQLFLAQLNPETIVPNPDEDPAANAAYRRVARHQPGDFGRYL